MARAIRIETSIWCGSWTPSIREKHKVLRCGTDTALKDVKCASAEDTYRKNASVSRDTDTRNIPAKSARIMPQMRLARNGSAQFGSIAACFPSSLSNTRQGKADETQGPDAATEQRQEAGKKGAACKFAFLTTKHPRITLQRMQATENSARS